jgi:hypothetical protein
MSLRRGTWVAAAVLLAAASGHAQTTPDGLELTTVDPPRGEAAAKYRAGSPVQHEAVYATEVRGGELTSASRVPEAAVRSLPVPEAAVSGNVAMLLVVGVLALGLFLWLRFGGSGLLAPAPKDAAVRRAEAPEAWKLDADRDMGTEDLLRAIAAMPDRRAAMVRLLRHCLLHAASASGTRLARSDTERSALRRLPNAWHLGRLPDLLTRTELAHYGGQEVSEDRFADSLAAARAILGQRGMSLG